MDHLTSSSVSQVMENKSPIIQAFNIFLRHHAKLSPTISTIGTAKSFSETPDVSSKWNLGAGLVALRGFFSSVRVATSRILVNVNVTVGTFYDPIPLDQLILNYASQNRFSHIKVNGFLKRLRVRVVHLPEKKNKAGQLVPRVKTIFGLATKNDGTGEGTDIPPPRVKDFGAGPKNVEFFLRDAEPPPDEPSSGKKKGGAAKGKKGDKGGSQPGPASGSQGQYISVYEYFRRSGYSSIP